MDFYNKDGTWNEVWASWSVSKPLGTHLLLSNGNLFCLLLILNRNLHRHRSAAPSGFSFKTCVACFFSKTKLRSVTPEESDLPFTLLPPLEVSLTEELADTLRTGDTGTDLRINLADACSLGHDGEKYFLVIVDKGTEHVVPLTPKRARIPLIYSLNISLLRNAYPNFCGWS
jgi:hypothetical protein